ncbi:hypothetical protein D9756_008062 [Leucocoprinus leucothites]|uniref:PEBP-like protein n=1 Tax=Leucocoprinus leucothites TaxID=201217 RepID=A0A8H5D494_9AGAR|nr:hypothetical protein D9756_008062 [Leucoagaricus leucothites]
MQLFHLFAFVAVAIAQDLSTKNVKDAFYKARIPQDTGINFNPTAVLEVAFPQQYNLPFLFHTGEHVPINSTTEPPMFSLLTGGSSSSRSQKANCTYSKDQKFVVTLFDPDANTPEDSTIAQVRHFLGGNFSPLLDHEFPSGINIPLPLVNSTPAVSEWVHPQPPPASGLHRYIFLAFKQPEGFDQQTLVTAQTSVLGWNLTHFAASVGLGDPIAGTYMLVSHEY